MRIVVVGAAGLIGTKTVDKLRARGHEVVPASRSSGVNTVTGEGLSAALKDADVVVDVSNSPSWEEKEVMDFFETSTRNMLAAEVDAGVKHHVALSVVGTENLLDSAYFRAKMAQEKLIKEGKVPYTIVQATQFFEFLGGIAQAGTVGDEVHLSSANLQPVSADDVAEEMVLASLDSPVNGTVEIAGPDKMRLCDFVEKYMKATNDKRKVVGQPGTPYFGMVLKENSLCPGANGKVTATSFDKWFESAVAKS